MVWNLATLRRLSCSERRFPIPSELGVDLIFPLAFLALLVPLIRTRVELVVASASGALAFGSIASSRAACPSSLTGVGGSLLGAYLTRGTPPDRTIDLEDAAREVA